MLRTRSADPLKLGQTQCEDSAMSKIKPPAASEDSHQETRSNHESADRVGRAVAQGRSLRKQAPRSQQGIYKPSLDRRDPIEILEESSRSRVAHLVPIRYGRMLQS